MRNLTWWLAGSALLATLGCSGGGSNNPVAPTSLAGDSTLPTPQPVAALSAAGTLGTPAIQGDLASAALAIYTIDIDPTTLQATATLKETRSGQANDDLYFLSIDSFLNAKSFRISGVSATATTVDVSYTVTHPFPAPNNPTGTPNGSTNRADLGIAGMVLFLADVTSATGNTYFTDRVANTSLIANADAYYMPGALLSVTGTANTFPYRQLVDELAGGTGSRNGQSNGGDVTGNFGTDGWTRAEFGTSNDGWTGYGVLHQGQSSSNTVSIDKASIGSGFSLDTAIVAKYNDPRGGATAAAKKANRLPPAAADASLFAYRMPHGALDGASIVAEAESGGFTPNAISASTLSFHIVDWDARATETTEADLANDASFTNVAQGESGTPTVEVCIPGVLGDATFVEDISTVVDDDSGFGGDAGQDSGIPGDSLFYSEVVTKSAGSGQAAGAYTGMVRVTDPETGLSIGLDEDLLPLPTAPEAVTYQAFTVDMGVANTAPTGAYIVQASPILAGEYPTIQITAMADAENDDLTIQVDWDNDGTYDDADTQMSPYTVPAFYTSPTAMTVTGTRNLPVRLFDGTSTTDLTTQQITINPNPCTTNSSTGAPRDAAWNFNAGVGYGYFSTGGVQQFLDFGLSRNLAHGAAGAFVCHNLQATTGNFIRRGVPLTTGAAMGATTTITASVPATEQAHQIEVDSLGRVFYTTYATSVFSRRNDPATKYLSGTNTIRWFDIPVTGTVNYALFNVITMTSPVVALALDENDNLLVIDNQNILHRRTKASGYLEDVTAPYPIDLKAAPYNYSLSGTGATDVKVCDFIYNRHNDALYILGATREDLQVADNGRLLRIECDGAVRSPLGAFRNANPINIPLYEGSTQSFGADIAIDDLDATGAPLAGAEADAQIMIGGSASQALPLGFPDYYIINGEYDVANGFYGVQSGAGLGLFPQSLTFGLNGCIAQQAGDSVATTAGATNAYIMWFATPNGTSWPITGWQ